MPWPVHPTGFFGARGDNDTYKIERSLRFNSADSAYLNRTPSASNQKTYTFNFWVKRSSISLASDVEIFSALFAATSSRYAYIAFEADDTLSFFSGVYSTGASTTVSYQYRTTQVFRDPSAWYMITASVDTTNATASERVKLYVNGTQITSFSTATQPALNQNGYWNSPQYHGIGTFNGSTGMFPGYLAEINFIDGQALTPSSFGETDAITGRWKAKAFSGSYGTNGFYLKFADNSGTTATTLGRDSSGNGNNWTPNNFSVSAYAANDSLVDSPTNYGSDTGVGGEVRGNYATLNPISTIRGTIIDGNLRTNGGDRGSIATIGMSSGKWFCEMYVTTLGAESSVGISRGLNVMNTYVGAASDSWGYYYNGLKYNNATSGTYGSSYTAGDTVGVAFDADAGTLIFTKNGVSQGTAYSSLTSGPYYFAVSGRSSTSANDVTMNFGQQAWKYAPPSGYKALCTTNLPQPTIQKPGKYMDVVAYTGTGASNSISSLGFSPDLVWIKNRGTTTSHAIYDTTRGAQNQLSSDTTGAEVTSSTGLTAFGSNGFTVGTSSLVNTSGTQYVAWSWDEAPIAGMDIVSYTGTGAIRTVAHNLGVAPKMIIAKLTNSAGFQWPVYHSSLTSSSSYIWLNSTNAQATDAAYWGTAPTSSVFSVGTNANVNNNTSPYIAYLFAEVEGFSRFGSYTGNGSADGPFVWCGFRPRWVMAKSATGAYNWHLYDAVRNTANVCDSDLLPNSSSAEVTASPFIDILSNGFKVRASDIGFNGSGATFIFAAFAESPFKYARAR